MSEPWYSDGLKFTCTQCGRCCTGAPGYVWVTDDEITAIARELGEPVAEVRAVYTRRARGRRTLRERANGDCVFYEKSRGCTVYRARPVQCRTWPFWQSNVESPEEWRRTAESCPGAGRGEWHSADEVTRRVSLIVL